MRRDQEDLARAAANEKGGRRMPPSTGAEASVPGAGSGAAMAAMMHGAGEAWQDTDRAKKHAKAMELQQELEAQVEAKKRAKEEEKVGGGASHRRAP